MSKTWKWILGIVITLLVVAAVVFVGWSFFASRHAMYYSYSGFQHPTMRDFDNFRTPMNTYRDFRSPTMGSRGFMPWPFKFFGGLLRLIFPLGVLFLVGFFSYKKGKKDGMATSVAAANPEPVVVEEEASEA